MSYDEPRFIAQNIRLDQQVAVATSTYTASAQVLTATPTIRQALTRACILTGARAVVSTAGVSASPTVSVAFGGTIGVTFATSHTLGAVSAAVTTNATVTGSAGEVPVITIVHTGTASATQITPVLELTLEFKEQFS